MEIHRGIGESRRALQILGDKPALVDKRLKAEQQWISRHAGVRLVWGISQTRRAEGKNLPEPLPAFRQKISKVISAAPKVADAGLSGERSGVQQNAASSHKLPHSIFIMTALDVRDGEGEIQDERFRILYPESAFYEQPLVSPQFMHL